MEVRERNILLVILTEQLLLWTTILLKELPMKKQFGWTMVKITMQGLPGTISQVLTEEHYLSDGCQIGIMRNKFQHPAGEEAPQFRVKFN
ncbi:hypothetical protein D3C84_256450 [compost metagenome]